MIGSLNANIADRTLDRSDLHSVQLIDSMSSVRPVEFFSDWGALGISSMCWHPDNPYIFYVATESALFRIALSDGQYERLEISNLADVHEITIIDNVIWIANTGHDQIVAYDIKQGKVTQRLNLSDYRASVSTSEDDPDTVAVDTFHCNQVFQGYDGSLYVLVHAVSGRQLKKKVARKLLRTQADGGVINLTNDQRYSINLKAPHSVRLVDNSYWIFDSMRFKIDILDKDWNFVQSVETRGFGRGGYYDSDNGTFFAGISATRKRYLRLLPAGEAVPNTVQVFDVKSYTERGKISIPNVEQINNVYCLPIDVADALINLAG
ncbi:hypothetical protein ABQF26_01885 [Mycolicibacterium elephantis]